MGIRWDSEPTSGRGVLAGFILMVVVFVTFIVLNTPT